MTSEQCRQEADWIEEQEVPTDRQWVEMLRAHASALEELARLKAPVSEGEIAEAVQRILGRVCYASTNAEWPNKELQEAAAIIESLAAKVADEHNRANAINDRFQSAMNDSDRKISEWMHACHGAEAELAKMRGHAERMCYVLQIGDGGFDSPTVAAYRADYPKE